MSYCWILIISYIGSASLQYINFEGPGQDLTLLNTMESSINGIPLPYMNLHSPFKADLSNIETEQNPSFLNFYPLSPVLENMYRLPDGPRKRRTAKFENSNGKDDKRNWLPNLIDTDKTVYYNNEDKGVMTPFIIDGIKEIENATGNDEIHQIEKKSFSPWGGKRSENPNAEEMWTWKRAQGIREPSMPKRVRFSPWGGKRSGQMIVKATNAKPPRIIYSTSIPELTRIISSYTPNFETYNIAGMQYVPNMDKRHPIKILAIANSKDSAKRDELPFKKFIDNLPRMFKAGHPYVDIDLKKDGKRKMKFSAWGGKRSPPIIGPIWTPAPEDIKNAALEAVLMIRRKENETEQTTLH